MLPLPDQVIEVTLGGTLSASFTRKGKLSRMAELLSKKQEMERLS